MASIQFYAGPEDNVALRAEIDSLGLNVFEAEFESPGTIKTVRSDKFHGFITFLNPDQLNPYWGPSKPFPNQICGVTDPIIEWMPSYTLEHHGKKYIIHGHLFWEFRVESRAEEMRLGKQYFGKLSRWIRTNWPPPVKRGCCRGPHAQKMIQFEGYIPRGLPPSLNTEYVKI